ncbi:peroxiredoxin family protein [Bacterioplanoides sp.]|uniref:peroxiredoxin family protein n=1 Tax=Bacterioplanoides sp. TaxID=2066072 RepID=UPI003AFF8043
MKPMLSAGRAVLFFLLAGLALLSRAEPQLAPDFTLNNAAGEAVSLSDYRGKVVVLHFWATWCPYCKRLQPGLDALVDQYGDQGLEVLGVSFNEDEDAQPQEVLKRRGSDFMTLVKGGRVAAMYQVRGTPTTFFIDRQGRLRAVTMTSDPKEPGLTHMAKTLLAEQ